MLPSRRSNFVSLNLESFDNVNKKVSKTFGQEIFYLFDSVSLLMHLFSFQPKTMMLVMIFNT